MRRLLPLLALAACSPRIDGSGGNVAPFTVENVAWTDLVNCVANGGTLTKSGGQAQSADAGAISSQKILQGDGYVELSVAETSAFRFVGLAHAHTGTSPAEIDFAFRLQAGRADVYENGQWRADNTVIASDVLRVAVESGRARYYKNGALVYASTQAPTWPLFADAALVDAGATVANARIAGASMDGGGGSDRFIAGVAVVPSDTGAVVTWMTPIASDSTVDWGATAAYGASSTGNGAATMHAVTLAGLAPGTAYHFRVRSTDGNGDTATSPDGTFSTSGAPSAPRHRFCGWTLANGYVPADQDPGYLTFAAHADEFDAVHPVWWHLADATHAAPTYGEGSALILDHTTRGGARTLLIPTVAAVDNGEPSLVHQMLNDATLRAAHVAMLRDLAVAQSYDGLDLDYEHLPDGDRAAFSAFASQLANALHAAGKTLSFAVDALTGPATVWDYAALAAAADQLHVMGYDFHYYGSHPGPVAPLGWVQNVVSYIGTVDGGNARGKFILGLPNYGLAGSDGGVTTWAGTGKDALALAGAGYATTTTHMATCSFVDGAPIAAGRAPNAMTAQGHLFFDDLASLDEKVAAAQSGGLGGVTYWTIGGEPDQPGPSDFFAMVRARFPK